MELTLKDAIYIFSIGAGAIAYVVTSRIRTAHNSEKMDELAKDYKEKISSIEQRHKDEIAVIVERLNSKKRDLREFKEYIRKEVEELKKCASQCLDREKAEQKFVTRSEFKMMLENVDLKLDNLDSKITTLLEVIGK